MFYSRLKTQDSRLKGQHLAEYAILFSLVLAALIGMQTYVKRGLQGRYRDAADMAVLALRDETGDSGLNLQYEPYYLQARFTTAARQNRVETENLGGSKETTIDNVTERSGERKTLPAE